MAAADVARLEAGHLDPEPITLARLALALGIPVGFFGRRAAGLPIPIESCHLPDLRPSALASRRRVLALASLFIDLLDFLGTHFQLPLDALSGRHLDQRGARDAEALSLSLRRRWGLGLEPIRNVVRLLESKGIAVQCIDASFDDVPSFSFWHASRPVVLVSRRKGSYAAARFEAAHELGHLAMHADVVAGRRQNEQDADRFARAFLLPEATFGRECPRLLDWDALFELKRRWQVPIPCLLARGFELGKLSEPAYLRGLCLFRTEVRHEEAPEPPPENPRLVAEALELLGDEWSIGHIASELVVSQADVRVLLDVSGALSQT
jgi:Zn-dependent peptidase ImmA (M78 family)